MFQTAIIFLAAILAGFALANLPTSSVISSGMAALFTSIGGLVIILFSLALIVIGIKEILRLCR
ncbi:hypothetical protein ACLIBG_05675 [Virgibacillus sp. W0181]|uniref:hypothetical protein n=1 Tax=Virgibacillus sp. W0181 TaxID=3391581 RepID=UPI003F445891